MNKFKTIALWLFGLFAAAAFIIAVVPAGVVLWGLFRGNYGEKPLPTVAGPEATELLTGLNGFLVTPHRMADEGVKEIEVLALPGLKKSILRPLTDGRPEIVNSISGPDEKGRIAYVHGSLKTTYLKIIRIDGQDDEIIFEAPGGFAKIGIEDLCLSPKGGLVAFLRDAGEGIQFPGSYIGSGALEIWDFEKKNRLQIPALKALAGWSFTPFLSWFPDGRRLAYVAAVPKEDVPPFPVGFGQGFQDWPRIPAVHILDLETGKSELLHAGWGPVVSEKGESILVMDSERNYRRIETRTRQSESAEWPGRWGAGAIALLDGGLVLYLGLPTEGSEVRRSPYGSFKAGTQLLSIKVAELTTGKFQTLVPFIDPRSEASFGRLKDQ